MKKLITGAALICSAFFLFAAEKDSIYLPDLTTVIEGESSVPNPDEDFTLSAEFSLPVGTGELEPELPSFEISEGDEALYDTENSSEKLVFAEGKVGAGYPGNFIGDFSVYRVTGNDPFKISFNYDGAEGYSGKSYSEGFNDRNMKIGAEKTFSGNNMKWKVSGKYTAIENGLQGKVSELTTLKQQDIGTGAEYSWILPNGFLFDSTLDLGLYNRFADTLSSASLPLWLNDVSVFSLTPTVKISWNSMNYKNPEKRSFDANGVTSFFKASYWMDRDWNGHLIDSENRTLNRGEFKAGVSWKNDTAKFFGEAGVVLGDQIGDNYVLVPFTLGMNAQLPVYFSNRKIRMDISGGMNTIRSDVGKLEEAHRFSVLSFMPQETSDWFGIADINIPVKTSVTLNLNGEYRKTALNNFCWEPVYESPFLVSGGYKFATFDRQLIKTHEKVSFTYKIFTLSAGWLSFWDFVPAGYDKQSITLNLSFQSLNSLWGVSLNSYMGIVTNDYTPKIDIEAYIRVTPQVRIAVNIADTIKLVTGECRDYAGQYIDRGGSATMLVKFFF